MAREVEAHAVTSFRYCTTCKRFLERHSFYSTRKTCSTCLSKSKERALARRCKLRSRNADLLRQQVYETLSKLRATGRKNCSSCKAAKAFVSFAKTRKTCKTCLEKRRTRFKHRHVDRYRYVKSSASLNSSPKFVSHSATTNRGDT